MLKNRKEDVQHTIWFAVSSVAPILSLAGKTDWRGVALCACCGLIVCLIRSRVHFPGWIEFLEIFAAILFLGTISRESSTCWQSRIDPRILSIGLLLVAGGAVKQGAQQACRATVSLGWLLLPGIALILLAGAEDLKIWNVKAEITQESWIMLPIFLLPVVAGREGDNGKRTARQIMLVAFGAIGATIFLQASSVGAVTNAFYEYSKGVTLFGIGKRFEAISACLLTISWFGLFTYVLAVIRDRLVRLEKMQTTMCIWFAIGVSILILYNLTIPAPVMAVISLISWGVLPVLTQVVERVQKMIKSDKTA